MKDEAEKKMNQLLSMYHKKDEELMQAKEELIRKAKEEQNLENAKAIDELKNLITNLEKDKDEMSKFSENLLRKIKEKEQEQEQEKKENPVRKIIKAGLGIAASVAFSILSGKFSGAEVRITKT